MRHLTLLLICCWAVAAPARADPAGDFARGYALADKKGCFECHAIGYTVVGPSFLDIARHYRFDIGAREHLFDVIERGSRGHWGERFSMWPQTDLTEAQRRQLVDWVLSQE